MVKAFDPADLAEKLKGKGLIIAEEGVKILEEAVIEWIKESVVVSETKLDDIAIPILDALKPFIDAQIAKIDGKQMNLDSIIAEIEKDAVQWGVKLVIAQLGLASWVAIPIVGPLLSMFLSKIVKMIVDGIDLVAYYKYKAVINNAQAVAYQDAVYATLKATEKGDMDAINKARAEQIAMFNKLFSFTH